MWLVVTMLFGKVNLIPLLDDGIGKHSLSTGPTIHQVHAICIHRQYHVGIPSGLHAEHIDALVHLLAVIQDELEHVDVAVVATTQPVAHLSVCTALLVGAVQPASAGLLVTVDKDVVVHILGLSDFVHKLPDTALGAVTNITTLGLVNLPGLLQHTPTLGNGIYLAPVTEGNNVSLVAAHSSQNAGQVVNLGDNNRAILTGDGTPGGTAVVRQTNGTAIQLWHVVNGDVHALLQRIQCHLSMHEVILDLLNGLICAVVAEWELLAGKYTSLQLLHISLNGGQVLVIVQLLQYIANVAEHSHVAHVDGADNLSPGLTLRTKVLPGLLIILNCHRTGFHELTDDRAAGMANANSVNDAHVSVLVLGYLIGLQLTIMVSPRTLKDAGHLSLTLIQIDVVGNLRCSVIGPAHNLGIYLGKLAGIHAGKLLTLRMHGRTNHDDLRVQTNVEIVTELNCPVQGSPEIEVQSIVNDLLHLRHGVNSLGVLAQETKDIILHEQVHHTTVHVHESAGSAARAALTKLAVLIVGELTEDGRSRHHPKSSDGVHLIGLAAHVVGLGLIDPEFIPKILLATNISRRFRNLTHINFLPIIY